MKFETYFTVYNPFLKNLEQENRTAAYYIARIMLTAITSKAYSNKEFRNKAFNYFSKGSTILLKEILHSIGYKLESIEEFNAFALIDSNSLK